MDHDASSEKPAGLVNRRSLMGRLGASAAGAAAVGAMAAGGLGLATQSAKAVPSTNIDVDVLNFALNLEYLEAEFYLRAFFGTGLQSTDVTGVGTQGTVTGGTQVPFKVEAIQQYCQLLAADELTHVRFLRNALGTAAVAEPNINLATSFTTLAVAAGLISAGQTFDPFANDFTFLFGAFIFEDVGVTAYNGAATLITNPNYLQAAAGILGTEAYHAGMIRTLLANIGGGAEANKIAALRATLSGAADDQGIIVTGNSYNAASTDENALCFARTTTQVLNIVYGSTTAVGTGGLFFPNGLNGTIR
jgi:hypothetical protein